MYIQCSYTTLVPSLSNQHPFTFTARGCCGSKTKDSGSKGKNKTDGPNVPDSISPFSPVSSPTQDGVGAHTVSNSYSVGHPTSPVGAGAQYPGSGQVSPMSEIKGKVYLARYAYQARTAEDLSFEKGERLLIIGGQESDWWFAKSLKSQREGYIPRNYIAEAQTYEAEE